VIGRADNGGPGLARNTGWDVALGDYVAFLDADDAWHPKKLELHIGWLAKHPEAVLSGTRSLVLKDGPVPVAHAVFRARRVGFAQIFISTQFITRTVVVKREIRLRFEGRRVAEDFLLWARIVATGAPCYVLDVPLSFAFREDFDPGGLSGFLWAQEVRVLAALWRLVECGELSVVAWLPCFALSLCKYLRRLWIVRRRRMQRAKEPRPATGSFTNAA